MNWRFWETSEGPSDDTCAAIEPLLSLHSDGMTSPDEAARIQAHLADCPECAQALRWMEATNIALQRRPAALPPADLRARIAAAIAESEEQATLVRPAPRRFTTRTAYGAAASLVLVGFVSYAVLREHPHPTDVTRSGPSQPAVVAVNPHETGPVVKHTPMLPSVPRTVAITPRPQRPVVVPPTVKPTRRTETALANSVPEKATKVFVAPAPRPVPRATSLAANRPGTRAPQIAFSRPTTEVTPTPGTVIKPSAPPTMVATQPAPEIRPPALTPPPVSTPPVQVAVQPKPPVETPPATLRVASAPSWQEAVRARAVLITGGRIRTDSHLVNWSPEMANTQSGKVDFVHTPTSYGKQAVVASNDIETAH